MTDFQSAVVDGLVEVRRPVDRLAEVSTLVDWHVETCLLGRSKVTVESCKQFSISSSCSHRRISYSSSSLSDVCPVTSSMGCGIGSQSGKAHALESRGRVTFSSPIL